MSTDKATAESTISMEMAVMITTAPRSSLRFLIKFHRRCGRDRSRSQVLHPQEGRENGMRTVVVCDRYGDALRVRRRRTRRPGGDHVRVRLGLHEGQMG